MERTPFGETRYGALFEDREGVRKYAKHHGARSRKVGESFAQRLAELGVREGRVLDAGAGSGDTAIALAEALPQMKVVGLDLSGLILDLARQQADDRGLADRVSFVEGDCQAMPFDDDHFHAVVSQDILHCVPDPVAMVSEIERVLEPTGTLLLRNIRRCWLGWLDGVFKTAYTADEVRDILREGGLRPWRIQVGFMTLTVEAGPHTAS